MNKPQSMNVKLLKQLHRTPFPHHINRSIDSESISIIVIIPNNRSNAITQVTNSVCTILFIGHFHQSFECDGKICARTESGFRSTFQVYFSAMRKFMMNISQLMARRNPVDERCGNFSN